VHLARLLGDPSEADRQAAADWIDADPHHAVAFARMQAAWDSAERLRASPSLVNAFVQPPARARPRRRLLAGGLIAASVAVCCVFGGWAFLLGPQTYRTGVGEQRTIHLADGSVIELNTASLVRVTLGKSRRDIRLVRGEAQFQVAHDPSRPFVVDAASARLRAVGTAFDVRIRSQAVVDLTVTQGVVAVLSAAGHGAQPRVAAGQAAVIDSGAVAETVLGGQALRQRVAWQQGVIELNGETLAQVVDEFNRYQAHPIVIGDARLESLRIGGRFQVNEADRFLAALTASFPIDVIHTSDGGVLLTARPPDRYEEKSSDPG